MLLLQVQALGWGNYTVVQADDNVAGTGATDGATQKGVSGFDSTHFTATSNGWIQLKPQANANGALVSLNNTAPSTRVEAGGLTTFTVDVTNAAVFGTGALGERVKVEVTEGAAPFPNCLRRRHKKWLWNFKCYIHWLSGHRRLPSTFDLRIG